MKSDPLWMSNPLWMQLAAAWCMYCLYCLYCLHLLPWRGLAVHCCIPQPPILVASKAEHLPSTGGHQSVVLGSRYSHYQPPPQSGDLARQDLAEQ